MKIAFIGQKGILGKFGGGVESHVEDLALGLTKEGHQVIVYIRPYYCRLKVNKIRKYKGVTLIKLPTIKTKYLDAITHTFLASLDVLRRDVDIIHYHSIGPASLLLIPKLFKRKARVVFTFHSQDYYHQKWGKLAKIYLKIGEVVGCFMADQVIVISKSIKRYVAKKYGVRATFIPNGVKIAPKVNASLIRKWGLEKNNYILCVARMVPHKKIHMLIGAYKQLVEESKRLNKKLVIVGGGAYTDLYVKYLENYAQNNKNIILTGSIPGNSKALGELYGNAYLYVHPSESEGLSISLLEAASFGIPVLVSNIVENRDVVGLNGFYFENKDSGDLKDKIRLLVGNKRRLSGVGKKLKQEMVNNYNWKGLTKRVQYVYIIAQKRYQLARNYGIGPIKSVPIKKH